MWQSKTCEQIFVAGTLVTVSWAFHAFARRFLPVDMMHFAPAISWGFTNFCLVNTMGGFYTMFLNCHIILALAAYWKYGNSNVLLNRALVYPAAGSMVPLLCTAFLPSVSKSAMIGLLFLQVWSVVGSVLMLVIFPAALLSQFEPQNMREEQLSKFMRQTVGKHVTRMNIPSCNGIMLDAVVIQQKDVTDRWIIYFGGNAEFMENSVEDISSFDEIIRANWIFYNPRGVGHSTGYVAEVRDLVDDAAAVVRFASTRYNIPSSRLLLWGHSIGGGVAAAVARQEGGKYPVLLDRTFSRLGDAAVAFSPLPPLLTRQIIRHTAGDLNVVDDCRATPNSRKLVIYHRMDEVIEYEIASLGRQDALCHVLSDKNAAIELRGRHVQSPHNSALSAFFENMDVSCGVDKLFL